MIWQQVKKKKKKLCIYNIIYALFCVAYNFAFFKLWFLNNFMLSIVGGYNDFFKYTHFACVYTVFT